MKKIYKKNQLLEVNNIPSEVIEGIKATIDILNIVNYIIFLYSEDIFFSKAIPNDILQNKNLIDVSKQSSMVISTNPFTKAIEKAKDIYDLNKHNNIPNLLSEKYKLR